MFPPELPSGPAHSYVFSFATLFARASPPLSFLLPLSDVYVLLACVCVCAQARKVGPAALVFVFSLRSSSVFHLLSFHSSVNVVTRVRALDSMSQSLSLTLLPLFILRCVCVCVRVCALVCGGSYAAFLSCTVYIAHLCFYPCT